MELYFKKSRLGNKSIVNQRLLAKNLKLPNATDLILSKDYTKINNLRADNMQQKWKNVINCKRKSYQKSLDFDKFPFTKKYQNYDTAFNMKTFREILSKSRNSRHSVIQIPTTTSRLFHTINATDAFSGLEEIYNTKRKTRKIVSKYPKINSDRTLPNLSDVSNRTSLPIAGENVSTHDPSSASKPKNLKKANINVATHSQVNNIPQIMKKIMKSHHSESPISKNIINIVNNVNPSNDNNIDLKMNINRYDIKYYVRDKSEDDYSDKAGSWLEVVENETDLSKGRESKSNSTTRVNPPPKYIEINRATIQKNPLTIDTKSEMKESRSQSPKEKLAIIDNDNLVDVKKISGGGKQEKNEETNDEKMSTFHRLKLEYANRNKFPDPVIHKSLSLNLKFRPSIGNKILSEKSEESGVKCKYITSKTCTKNDAKKRNGEEEIINNNISENRNDVNDGLAAETCSPFQLYETQCGNKTGTFNHGESKIIEEEPNINSSFHQMLDGKSSIFPQQSELQSIENGNKEIKEMLIQKTEFEVHENTEFDNIETEIQELVQEIFHQIINEASEPSYTNGNLNDDQQKKSFHYSFSDHESDTHTSKNSITPINIITSVNIAGDFPQSWTPERNHKHSPSLTDEFDLNYFKIEAKRKGYQRTFLMESLTHIQRKFVKKITEKSTKMTNIDNIMTQLAMQMLEKYASGIVNYMNDYHMQKENNNENFPVVSMNVNINEYLNKKYFEFFGDLRNQIIDKDYYNEESEAMDMLNYTNVLDNFKINAMAPKRMTFANNAIFKDWIFHHAENLSIKNQVFISGLSLRDVMNNFLLDEKNTDKNPQNAKLYTHYNVNNATQKASVRFWDEMPKIQKSFIDENKRHIAQSPSNVRHYTNLSKIGKSEDLDEHRRKHNTHTIKVKKIPSFATAAETKKSNEMLKAKEALKSYSICKLPYFLSRNKNNPFLQPKLSEDSCTNAFRKYIKRRSTKSGSRSMTKEVTLLRTMEIKTTQAFDLHDNLIESLIFFIKDKNKEKFLELFQQNLIHVDINAQDEDGNTLLSLSVQSSCYDITEFLLIRGCDPNLQNNLLNTPLHYALSTKDFQLANILLKHGANEDLVNKEGLAPWECLGIKCSEI